MRFENRLFQPIRIGRMTVKNRIECAPYGDALFGPDGSVGNKQMQHLRELFAGGVGMVTIGSANCNLGGGPSPVPFMHNIFLLGEYVNIVELAHQYNVRIGWELFGAKEMFLPAEVLVNTYTVKQIHEYQKGMIEGAVNALDIGSDYIMIHGGHGQVPAAFYRKSTNHRTDEYGGSFENRIRIITEILDGIRERAGDKLAIEYRISGEELQKGGLTLEEQIAFAKAIEDRVDLFNITRGVLSISDDFPQVFPTIYDPHGINVENAAKFRAALHTPVSVVGGNNMDNAEEIVKSGSADLVAMVRQLLADPACVKKYLWEREQDIRPCIRCNNCINTTHGKLWDLRCSVNALIGWEYYFGRVERKAIGRKVLLIGGGPANLEAARIASKRGHQVVLCERTDRLGGNLIRASREPIKADLRKYLEWSVRTVENDPAVEIRLNTVVTPDMVKELQPDAVIIAVGSTPIIPNFTANETEKLQWVGEMNFETMGENVVIAGGGFTGLEAALDLSTRGKHITVVDMIQESELGKGASVMNTVSLLQKLKANGVSIICRTRIEDVTEEGAIVKNEEGIRTIPCDCVILSLGQRANITEAEQLSRVIPETRVIGDCSTNGGNLQKAIHAGFEAAFEL